MTGVNEMNERTQCQDSRHRLAALTIAVYSLPAQVREKVVKYAERNYQRIARDMEPEYEAIEYQDTQAADYERCESERRQSEQFDHPR